MIKRILQTLSILLCVALLTTGVSALDLSFTDGSLAFELMYDEKPLDNLKVSICKVADVEFVDVYGSMLMRYNLVDAFTGAVIYWDEFLAGEDGDGLTTTEMEELSIRLNSHASRNPTTIIRDIKTTGTDGRVIFEGMGSGLYLVAQDDLASATYRFSPALVRLPHLGPSDGEWKNEVTALPKTEKKVEQPVPTPTPTPTPTPNGYGPPGTYVEPRESQSSSGSTPTPQPEFYFEIPNSEISLALPSVETPSGDYAPDPEIDDLTFNLIPPLRALPQTGVLRWPIPFLSALGSAMMLSGMLVHRRDKKRRNMETSE